MAKIKRTIPTKTIRKDPPLVKPITIRSRIQGLFKFVKPKPTPVEIPNEVILPDPETPQDPSGEDTGAGNTELSNNIPGNGDTDPESDPNTSSTTDIMEPMIGEIKMFAGNFAPRGWLLCDGQLLSIQAYSALFSLLGTTYGGDGRNTFGLPDLRGRVPIHAGQGGGLSDYHQGHSGGTETVTLTESHMPAHNHSVSNAQGPVDSSDPESNMLTAGESQIYSSQPAQSNMNPSMINNAGGGQAHNNIQPYLAINFIIAIEGVYPARS